MEVYYVLIEKAAIGGFLPSYRVMGRNGEEMNVTYLLFANNTLEFYQDSVKQMVFMSWVLVWFEALPGLKINLDKSYICRWELCTMWISWL